MMLARSRTRPPAQTSSTCSRTRSHPLSLLSMARLNNATSRAQCLSWSRTRIAQTSSGLSGRFCPVRRPLFQGAFCMIASIEPTTPSAAHADWQAGQSIRTTGLATPTDVRSGHPYLPRPTRSGHPLDTLTSRRTIPKLTFVARDEAHRESEGYALGHYIVDGDSLAQPLE